MSELSEDDAKTMERIEDEVDVTPLLEAREWAFAQVKRYLHGHSRAAGDPVTDPHTSPCVVSTGS